MLTLTALAMNPNLSTAEFMELTAQTMNNQSKLMALAVSEAKTLRDEYGSQMALDYLSQVLPILLMF